MNQGFSAQWLSLSCCGYRIGSRVLEQKSEGCGSKLFPFLSVLPPLGNGASRPRGQQPIEQRVWSRCPVRLGRVRTIPCRSVRESHDHSKLPPPAPVMATLPCSKVVPGPSQLHPPQLHTLLDNGSLHSILNLCQPGTMLGDGWGALSDSWSGKNARSPGQVSICCRLVPRCNQVCSLHRCSISFLSPSFKSHWLANQLRGLVCSCWTPVLGPQSVIWTLASQDGISKPVISLLFRSSPTVSESWPDHFFCSFLTLGGSFFVVFAVMNLSSNL